MPKLHLVGITPDNRGLVLSEHAQAQRGDLILEIDDRLVDTIERAQRRRQREEGKALESNALPTRRESVPADPDTAAVRRPSPREIQHRLRLGETVTSIAKSCGVDEEWIGRFAAPILAEQERVVDEARALTFTRPRAGPSALPLGPAVAANALERGVPLTLEDIDRAWRAYQRSEGGPWCVTFSYSFRGRRHTAEWDVDVTAAELTARNKLATELGFRDSARVPAAAAAGDKNAAPGKTATGKAGTANTGNADAAAKGRTAGKSPAKGSGDRTRPAAPPPPGDGPQTLPGTDRPAKDTKEPPAGDSAPAADSPPRAESPPPAAEAPVEPAAVVPQAAAAEPAGTRNGKNHQPKRRAPASPGPPEAVAPSAATGPPAEPAGPGGAEATLAAEGPGPVPNPDGESAGNSKENGGSDTAPVRNDRSEGSA